MKIAFCANDAYGHVFPLLPLAVAARDAGHDVTFLTGASFEPMLRGQGFDVRTREVSIWWAERQVKERFPGLVGLPPDEGLDTVAFMFGDLLARAAADEVVPTLAEVDPDLLVYECMDVGAGLAGALRGIPVLNHSMTTIGVPPPMQEAMEGHLAGVWAEHTDRPAPPSLVYGAAHLDTWPGGLGPVPIPAGVPRIPIRPVPWGDPRQTLPEWLTRPRTRPLVFLTLGTVPFTTASLREAIDGLGKLPVDVLVALGPHADPGALPDSVRVEQFVRQDLVMPLADVVVHHGGTGTTMGALVNGVPQLVLPQMADQFQNAEVMLHTGVAQTLMPGTVTAAAVSDAVRELLDGERYRVAAASISDQIRGMPAPAEVVPRLEELLGGRAG